MEVNPNVELVFFVIVLLMIPLCITMNILVIGIIVKKHAKRLLTITPKTIILYFNLAISDMIMGVVAMPWVLYYIQIERPSPPVCSGDINCTSNSMAHIVFRNFSGYGYNVATRVTSLIILILSIDRFHAIYFPTTYSRPVYSKIYNYATYMIWGFALGTSALPFLVKLEYQEQPTRELMCSWSITELLGIEQEDLDTNRHQILFPYFVLNFLPIVVPSLTSVVLSGSVFFRLFVKRVDYIISSVASMQTPRSSVIVAPINTMRNGIETRASDRRSTITRRKTLISIFSPAEEIQNKKLEQLTRASITMIYLVLLYIVSYAYWWFIITLGTVYLGGAYVPLIQKRNDNLLFQYVNNSYSMTAFLNSTISPFIVYFRVFRSQKAHNPNRASCNSQNHNGRESSMVGGSVLVGKKNNAVVVQLSNSKCGVNMPTQLNPIKEHFV